MGKDSEISWTHHTFNPWWGCFKVSDGCKHCYAETLSTRFGHSIWGPASTTQRRTFGPKHWAEPLKWNAAAEKTGERKRVFCASMADVFDNHPELLPEREKLWTLIEQTPWLDWLLLTKRPENIELMLPHRWAPYLAQGMPRNVWLGFSAEDQQNFDARWPVMESVKRCWRPSVVFVSAEPLLGPLDISDALQEIDLGDEEHSVWTATLDWVIAGGESGPGARPMHPDWARKLRDQCAEAGVAYHFKQWGEWMPTDEEPPAIGPWPGLKVWSDQVMKRIGKHASGRLLDGVIWDQFPA